MSIDRTNNFNNEAGFTLVEMLASLALVALLATGLLGGLSFGARVWQRAEAHGQEAEDIWLLRKTVGSWLRGARIERLSDDRRGLTPALSGNATSISFTSPMAGDETIGGLYRITLRLDPNTEQLQMTWVEEEAALRLTNPEAENRVLLTDVSGLRLQYYLESPVTKSGQWIDLWQDRDGLPAAISLDIAFAEGHSSVWPRLIVRPDQTASLVCAYDPVSRACRTS